MIKYTHPRTSFHHADDQISWGYEFVKKIFANNNNDILQQDAGSAVQMAVQKEAEKAPQRRPKRFWPW
jgi:hypothetical protein